MYKDKKKNLPEDETDQLFFLLSLFSNIFRLVKASEASILGKT